MTYEDITKLPGQAVAPKKKEVQIKYSKAIPPIYFKCKKQFGVSWDKGVAITYGDTVYFKGNLSADLVAHESTHVLQQLNMGVELWWERYLSDPEFRLAQEVDAYKNQMAYAKNNFKYKDLLHLFSRIVHDMAAYYGEMCTEEEAIKLLTE